MSARRFLIVDDDPLMVELVMLRVQMLGHQVQFARHGVQALEKVAAFRPDAMILDVDMPYLNGFEVLQRLGPAKLARLPTLMLTSRRSAVDVRLALRLGAQDFLMKPFETDDLLPRVRRLARGAAPVLHV